MPLGVTVDPAGQLTMARYTSAKLIVPQLAAKDTAGIIGELSQVLQRDGCVSDLLPFYHAALNHELMASSALPGGIALPHGRLGGVKQLRFAFGRAPEPVVWGPKGSYPVQLVFLLAVPATDAACYLHLLASLARLGQQPELLQALRSTKDATSILGILDEIRMRS